MSSRHRIRAALIVALTAAGLLTAVMLARVLAQSRIQLSRVRPPDSSDIDRDAVRVPQAGRSGTLIGLAAYLAPRTDGF
jgi:hypothetical protein